MKNGKCKRGGIAFLTGICYTFYHMKEMKIRFRF
nr:MAG TPA: hypothetical protein [Caudoviricetes sp.]